MNNKNNLMMDTKILPLIPRFPSRLLSLACRLSLPLSLSLSLSMALWAQADGKWLRRVPDEDHARINPFHGQAPAASAGKMLFQENCAKCHGADANGLPNRPSLRSERIRHASDGDLAWMLRNGNPYKGMPPWSSLPEPQRWQIIAYLRTLPAAHR